MDVEWDNDTVDKFYNYLVEIINYEKCLELEKDLRMETELESKLNMNSHACSENNNKINIKTYKFKKHDDDIIGEILDNEKDENIKKYIPIITKKTFSVYSNVAAKAKLEGSDVTLETDHFLRTYVFALVFTKYIIYNSKTKIREIHRKNTKNIVSLANPLHIKDDDLNKLSRETIADLMNNDVGIEKKFLGKEYMKLIYDELIFIEYNNQFNEFSREYKNVRTDLYCWAYITSLDKEKQKGLYKLLKELSLIPYELNKKTNLSLQVCALFQFLYFYPNKSFIKKHIEGGYGKLDNGKKITCIYIPLVDLKNDIEIKIYRNESMQKVRNEINDGNGNKNTPNEKDEIPIKVIKPESDSLIFLQTRNVSYEISKTKSKFFIINLWISGPVSLDKN